MLEVKSDIDFLRYVFLRSCVDLYVLWKSVPLAMSIQIKRSSYRDVWLAILADGRLSTAAEGPAADDLVDWVHRHLQEDVIRAKIKQFQQ